MASLQKRTVKGKEYWSIVESKRINGKPRPIVIEYIGNTKKLLEKIQNNTMKTCALKSFSHGDSYALFTVAQKIGVEKILDETFSPQSQDGIKRSTSLLLAAIHRACKPGSKSKFADWFCTTSLPYERNILPDSMDSRHFWKQMEGITEKELMCAEDAITKIVLNTYEIGLQKLALDYTNYFTYIATGNTKNELTRRGHHKQKRHDLRQCSLALVTSKETGIPLFSHVYEGNRNDQTEFREYLPILGQRIPDYDPKEITLIFDGGSNTKENLTALDCHYICSFPLSYCKELYDVEMDHYEELQIREKWVKCYRTTKNIWGNERVAILSFSPKLYDGQARELEGKIMKAYKELSTLNEKMKDPKSRIDTTPKSMQERVGKIIKHKYLSEIIRIQIKETGILYEIDEAKKIEITRKYFGKKLLISDRNDWETEEILCAYYEQDCIEKIFRDTKDTHHFSLFPIYHWTDQKIRVHIFICLLGLTLTAVLQKELRMRGIELSKDELIEKLSLIRQCWIKEAGGNKIIKVLEEMDERQSKIWDIIGGV